jgi:hypothetical protein
MQGKIHYELIEGGKFMKKLLLTMTILMSFNLLAGKYTGGTIDGIWYAWYDGTFSGKENLTTGCKELAKSKETEEFDMSVCIDSTYFKNLELTVTDITMKDNIINLKVSDFKLTDKENNIYTPNSYPTKNRIKFYPNVYIDKNSFEEWLRVNKGNTDLLKNINKKMKNSIKLNFSNDKLFITSNLDGKNIYLSNNSNFEADAEYTFGFLAFTLAQNYYLEKNYKEAEENYLIAIETGNIEGPALNLGKLFLELKDYPNAKKYYKMAADLGNEEAQRIYREILQNGY